MSNKDSRLTAARLRYVLDYNSETGVFVWRLAIGRRAKVGATAGGKSNTGYWRVKVDGVFYSAHRLAWLHVYGEWPAHEIDHVNGIRDDNRLSNLRDVTKSVNQQNRHKSNNGSATGFLGVTPYHGRYMAQIWVSGKYRFIGYFDSPENAHAAYLGVKRQAHLGCTI